jgi:hypothetical protein
VTVPFDRVVISCNENPLYIDFWPIISWAYKAIFPEIPVELAFLTWREPEDPFLAKLREYGPVTCYRSEKMLPEAGQTKMLRYFHAMQQPDVVSYCDDIDLLPLRRDWIISKTQNRPPGHLLLVGSEVYGGHQGKAPASQMTAEGRVFQQLLNPDNLDFVKMCLQWVGRPGPHQDINSKVYHEGSDCPTDAETLNYTLFSDEALIEALRVENPVPEHHEIRGFNVNRDTMDRAAWDPNLQLLEQGHYIQSHMVRPYRAHQAKIQPILDYIAKTYNVDPAPELWPIEPKADPDINYDGSGLQAPAYAWICDLLPAQSRIIEFGSGHVSTKYLSRYYEMISVEQHLDYTNLYPSQYIYAALNSADPHGWYDLGPIRRKFTDMMNRGQVPDLLIIDGPVGEKRANFNYCLLEEYPEFFKVPILIDDTNRPMDRQVAESLAIKLNRELTDHGEFCTL